MTVHDFIASPLLIGALAWAYLLTRGVVALLDGGEG